MKSSASKAQKIRQFDPNAPSSADRNIFGLPFTTEEADIVLIPVPWEVTVSYRPGTAAGPQAILDASAQVDLYDPLFPDLWKAGIAMDKIPSGIARKSRALRPKAERCIAKVSDGVNPKTDRALGSAMGLINRECAAMNSWVKQRAERFLDQGKLVGLLGGDHSTPLGLITACAERSEDLSILQIDAHADLRDSYEGFEFSHASIMFNALKLKPVKRLMQVGIRDYCEEEVNVIEKSKGRVRCYYDRDLKRRQATGKTWDALCKEIVRNVGREVYVSFDIDALDPKLCPNTGTPVPGGLEFEQACQLIERLVLAGKRIVGFDVNEVAPGEDDWDGNVGARLLYRIAGYAGYSWGLFGVRT